jgi:hypothetical protein
MRTDLDASLVETILDVLVQFGISIRHFIGAVSVHIELVGHKKVV